MADLMDSSLSYFTRPGCHLCTDALPLVEKLSAKYGFSVRQVNIDQSDDLTKVYGLRIPLLTTADETVLAEGIIQARPLRKALRKAVRAAGQSSGSR